MRKLCTATCLAAYPDLDTLLASDDVTGDVVVAFAGDYIDEDKLSGFGNVADFFQVDPEVCQPIIVADEAARLALTGLAVNTVVTEEGAGSYLLEEAGEEADTEAWTRIDNPAPDPDYIPLVAADATARLALTGLQVGACVKQTSDGHMFLVVDDADLSNPASWNEFEETT